MRFAPLPEVIRNDMAFLVRLHYYQPGWELPKMRNELFTDHYGLVVDYLAEAMRGLRNRNFTEIIDHHFSLGSHLNARDRKAVRRTVSGLMKIIYPHGKVSEEQLEEILKLALEGRRRVKEQLKKMGSFEYYNTSFSYMAPIHLCRLLASRTSASEVPLEGAETILRWSFRSCACCDTPGPRPPRAISPLQPGLY